VAAGVVPVVGGWRSEGGGRDLVAYICRSYVRPLKV
jgi:hypothetical protein